MCNCFNIVWTRQEYYLKVTWKKSQRWWATTETLLLSVFSSLTFLSGTKRVNIYNTNQAICLLLQLRVSAVQSLSFWIYPIHSADPKLQTFTVCPAEITKPHPSVCILCAGNVGRIAEHGRQTHGRLCLTINCALTGACKVISFCIFSLETSRFKRRDRR